MNSALNGGGGICWCSSSRARSRPACGVQIARLPDLVFNHLPAPGEVGNLLHRAIHAVEVLIVENDLRARLAQLGAFGADLIGQPPAEIGVRQQRRHLRAAFIRRHLHHSVHLLRRRDAERPDAGRGHGVSLVKLSTFTPAAWAMGATACASGEVNGPRIMPSPAAMAACAAAAAPCGVPPVSRTSSSGDDPAGKTSFAAFSRDWPTGARGPVNGTSKATLPALLPIAGPAPSGAAVRAERRRRGRAKNLPRALTRAAGERQRAENNPGWPKIR